jgi:tRNA(Ile)-lysidine synthase
MDSTILTLTWPDNFDMDDFRRFETEARARRYQALGRACRDGEMQAMMVAHHGDDQAETVLMRLSNNRLRTGLKAMQGVEWIPECDGIHGVHHSGRKQRSDSSLDFPFPVEQGGVQILRPLLAMEKSRLIATCKEHNVQWAEDKSNQLQTLTSRNAIRHIYKNNKLPEALSIKSLVDLSLHMQKRITMHRSHANLLYDQCLMKLDIQTGSLLVRFPPYSALLPRPIETDFDKIEARNTAYCLVEKVAETVTAQFRPALGQLAARLDSIYPEFLTQEDMDDLAATDEAHFRDKFTVHHIYWRQYDKASPFENNEDDVISGDFGHSAPHPKEWLLTRQNSEYGEAKRLQLTIPPSKGKHLDSTPSNTQEEYQFFDGRFWIKLDNYTTDTLHVRLFEKADMHHLPITQKNRGNTRTGTGVMPERFITAALSLLKPSDLRFTLPAVFRVDAHTGLESLIGFPTLNVRMNGFGPPDGVCDWKVRYKKVDFGSHAPGEMVVPGIRQRDIIEQERSERMGNKGIKRLKVRRQVTSEQTEKAYLGYKRVDASSVKDKDMRRKKPHFARRAVGEEVLGLEFLLDERGERGDDFDKGDVVNGGRDNK